MQQPTDIVDSQPARTPRRRSLAKTLRLRLCRAWRRKPQDIFMVLLAAMCVVAAIIRAATVKHNEHTDALDERTLAWVLAAAVVLRFGDITEVVFGKTKVKMANWRADVEHHLRQSDEKSDTVAKVVARAIQPGDRDEAAASTPERPGTTKRPGKGRATAAAASRPAEPSPDDDQSTDENDWVKGRFGGNARANGRRLTATWKRIGRDDDFLAVQLIVESTDPNRPLKEPIRFFVHDSFPRYVYTVRPSNGRAELDLISYGAFTAGAITDGGGTRLECDLVEELSDAPRWFLEA